MKNPELSLIIPCFNEEGLLRESVRQILRTLDDTRLGYEIIFVDDKSADRTPAIIRSLVRKNKNMKAVFHKDNMGRGRTVADGLKEARGKIAGYIDVDLEVSSSYIPSMVRMILDGEADVVLAKRVYRTTLISIPREIFSKAYLALADYLLNTGGFDTEAGYKFFNRKKILPFLDKCDHPHWFWDTQIIVYPFRAGLRVKEVPALYLRRFDKKSSVRVASDIYDYLVNLYRFSKKLKSER